MSIVLDANVLVALVTPDDHQPAAHAQFEQWLDAGETMHAPAVLPYEVANVLARLAFDGAMEPEDVTDTWRDLDALDLRLHQFDLIQDGPEVAAITRTLNRRHATDSTYICLARKLETTLWTFDGPLARNAKDNGLPVELIT